MKKVTSNIIILCIAGMFLTLTSCRYKSLYENTVDIPKGSWNQNFVLKFDIPVQDTENNFNIVFSIRNNDNYPYSNLYLFIDTKAPNGNTLRDTMEIELSNSSGKWLGKGIGGLWQNLIYYRKNIKFPVLGTYSISVKQAMREENLDGIVDMGIKVEQSKNK
jgi:gliding motility-associated lipoprotein GldH